MNLPRSLGLGTALSIVSAGCATENSRPLSENEAAELNITVENVRLSLDILNVVLPQADPLFDARGEQEVEGNPALLMDLEQLSERLEWFVEEKRIRVIDSRYTVYDHKGEKRSWAGKAWGIDTKTTDDDFVTIAQNDLSGEGCDDYPGRGFHFPRILAHEVGHFQGGPHSMAVTDSLGEDPGIASREGHIEIVFEENDYPYLAGYLVEAGSNEQDPFLTFEERLFIEAPGPYIYGDSYFACFDDVPHDDLARAQYVYRSLGRIAERSFEDFVREYQQRVKIFYKYILKGLTDEEIAEALSNAEQDLEHEERREWARLEQEGMINKYGPEVAPELNY